MDWFIIRHPATGGLGAVAECSLPVHRAAGWLRVSGPISEMVKDQVVLDEYAAAPDLDAPPAAPAAPDSAPPASKIKEK